MTIANTPTLAVLSADFFFASVGSTEPFAHRVTAEGSEVAGRCELVALGAEAADDLAQELTL